MTENENEELKDIMVEGFPVLEHTGGDGWTILHGDTLSIVRAFKPGVSGFSFERVCQMCSSLEPQAQRRFLSDSKQAAYTVERVVRRGLREMELSVTPEADYSVEQKTAVKENEQSKSVKVKKTARLERE